jgi:phosphorylcholine metabolism protein LicD
MPKKKLTKTQLALIIVAAVIFAFLIVAVGVSFYPFKLSDKDTLKLYQMMKDVDEVMRANNVPYIAESGTLLGSVRHGGLIPWDDDLDIQVLKENEAAFLALEPIFHTLDYDIRKTGFGHRIQPKGRKALTFPFCDVFITSFDDQGKSHNENHSFKKCVFLRSEYFPIKRYKFGDIEINGPAVPDGFLNKCYGNSWRDTWYKGFNHKLLYFAVPVPKKMKPQDYKPATPTGPLLDRYLPQS